MPTIKVDESDDTKITKLAAEWGIAKKDVVKRILRRDAERENKIAALEQRIKELEERPTTPQTFSYDCIHGLWSYDGVRRDYSCPQLREISGIDLSRLEDRGKINKELCSKCIKRDRTLTAKRKAIKDLEENLKQREQAQEADYAAKMAMLRRKEKELEMKEKEIEARERDIAEFLPEDKSALNDPRKIVDMWIKTLTTIRDKDATWVSAYDMMKEEEEG